MNYKEYINKVGLEVNTLLSPFTTNAYGQKGSRVFIGRSGNKIEAIVLHTTGNTASAKNEATNIHNNKPVNTGSSFHAVVDEYGVYECVLFKNTAYHAGNKDKNLKTLGFELTDDNASAGYENYIKYIAWVMHQENIVPSVSTVLFHNEIVATSCGAFLRNKGKTQIIADLNKYIAIAKGDVKPVVKPTVVKPPVVKPVVKPPTKKTNEQLAAEVLKGLWGNDPQRSKKLTEAGYDPKAVQAVVNGGSTPKPKPPVERELRVGDRVKIKSTAKKYATGQNIPRSYIGRVDTILQIGKGKVLLKGLYSWVYTKDVQRV